MSFDPDIIHECKGCGRSYAIRPIEAGMNHWTFHNVYCSSWCAMPSYRQQKNGFVPGDSEAVFLFLLDRAEIIYRNLRRQVHNYGQVTNPVYWHGWEYADAHPYRFASEFMDRMERTAFLSAHERDQFARYLFSLTNQMHYGVAP